MGEMARPRDGDGHAPHRHGKRGRCQVARQTTRTVLRDPEPPTRIKGQHLNLRDSITARSIQHVQELVNLSAVLALDQAAIAAQSGYAHHVAAALHLRAATSAAWLAAETLAEGACR
jgi:hypothetical protein